MISTLLLHTSLSLLIAVLLALYFITIGRAFLRHFVLSAPFIEKTVLSFPLGVGFATTLVFLLGAMGQIRFKVCLSLILLSWLLSSKETFSFLMELARWLKGLPRRLSPLSASLSLLLLAHGFLNLIFSLSPPIGTDALWYHLVVAKLYAETHLLSARYDIVWSFGPQLVEMLLTLGIVLHSTTLASLLCLMLSFLPIGALYQLGRRFLSREASLLAAALFWCMPLSVHYAPLIKNDLGMSAFLVLACDQYMLLNRQKPVGRSFLLLPLFLGLAAACKFTALPSLLVIGSLTLLSLRKQRREWSLPHLLLFGLLLIVPSLPYLIRSYLLTGNPLYPNAYRLFGGGFWSPEIEEIFSKRYVNTKSLVQFLTHPLRFSMAESFGGHVGTPLFLVFLPLLFLWRPLNKPIQKLLWISFLTYALSYFLFDVQSRYYFPVFCFLSVPTAYAIQKVWEERGLAGQVGRFFVGLFFLFNLLTTFALTRHQIPSAFGVESQVSYLSRMLPFYPVTQYANEHTEPNDRFVLQIPGYYLERDAINASFYGSEIMFYTLRTADKLEGRLQELGIRYVLLGKEPEGEMVNRLDWKLFGELRQRGTLTKLYSKNGYTLYRFHPTYSSSFKKERQQR